MNILAVDTSGAEIGVAAVHCDREGAIEPLAVLGLGEARQLSRQLIAAIDATLQHAGWTIEDVDGLAVGLGPGSWTGLRVGLTTCKTLAQVRDWPLVGVPTFDALAQAVWRQTGVAPDGDEEDETTQGEPATTAATANPVGREAEFEAADDANAAADAEDEDMTFPEHFLILVTAPCRPGEVYGKIYECEAEALVMVQPEWIGSPQLMSDTLETEALARAVDSPLVLTGPGAAAISEVLEKRQQAHFVVSLAIQNIVLEVALAGISGIMNGETSDPLKLQPLYLAPSAAERNLLGVGTERR